MSNGQRNYNFGSAVFAVLSWNIGIARCRLARLRTELIAYSRNSSQKKKTCHLFRTCNKAAHQNNSRSVDMLPGASREMVLNPQARSDEKERRFAVWLF